jgi:hypothetical protein
MSTRTAVSSMFPAPSPTLAKLDLGAEAIRSAMRSLEASRRADAARRAANAARREAAARMPLVLGPGRGR